MMDTMIKSPVPMYVCVCVYSDYEEGKRVLNIVYTRKSRVWNVAIDQSEPSDSQIFGACARGGLACMNDHEAGQGDNNSYHVAVEITRCFTKCSF